MENIYKKSETMIKNWYDSSSYPIDKIGDKFTEFASKGDIEILKEYYVNIPDSIKDEVVHYAGDRPLRMAAKNKNLECLIYLIEECGANIHAYSDKLDSAALSCNKDAVITSSCLNNDLLMLNYLLSKHPKKLCTDHNLCNTTSDLNVSISSGFVDITRRLFEHGEKEKFPLRSIYYRTPTEKLIVLFDFFINEIKYKPTIEEWNHMMVTSVGHNNLEALKWTWNNCPIKEDLKLNESISQACYCKRDGGPHPIIDYIIDVCGGKITIKQIGSSFNSTTFDKNGKTDRIPFLQWVENKGFRLKGNEELIEMAKRRELKEVIKWLME